MSIFSRLYTVIRGLFDERVRSLEWKHPDTVYENALKKKRANYEKAAEALAGMVSSERQQRERLTADLKRLERVERALSQAIERHDEQRGPLLVRERRALLERVETMRSKLVQTAEQIREGRSTLSNMERGIEQLGEERVRAVAQIRMLQARHDLDSLASFGADAPEDRALAGLRTKIEQEEIKQQVMNSTRNKADEAIDEAEFSDLCRKSRNAQGRALPSGWPGDEEWVFVREANGVCSNEPCA